MFNAVWITIIIVAFLDFPACAEGHSELLLKADSRSEEYTAENSGKSEGEGKSQDAGTTEASNTNKKTETAAATNSKTESKPSEAKPDSTAASDGSAVTALSPSQAYSKYHAHVHAQPDLMKSAASMATAASAKDKSADTMGELFQNYLAKTASPSKIKILEEKINGTRATLTVLGLTPGPMDTLTPKGKASGSPTGSVEMSLVNGEWKVVSERWESKLAGGSMVARIGSEPARKPAPTTPTQIWCAAAASAAFPSKPAYGKLHGQSFVVTKAVYDSFMGTLRFVEGNDIFFADREVQIALFEKKSPVGKSYFVSAKTDEFDDPSVDINWKQEAKGARRSASFRGSHRYGMRLQFGQLKNGLLPGYIVLRLPDKSFVEGYFYASMK